ncbi:MAG: hypothetical protein ABI411_08500 [Tahibacter sp.]
MNTFKWLLKREYWEHRGGFQWAPIITACVLTLMTVIGFVAAELAVGRIHFGTSRFNLNTITANMTPDQLSSVGMGIDVFLYSMAAPIAIVLFFVLFFYLLGSLYDERRDRSILFWKSLPVSDLHTVLSKVVMATIVVPVISVAVALLLMLAVLLVMSVFVMFHGINPITTIWLTASPLSVAAKFLILLPVNALWALPTIGWLMLCSAFAKRAVFLWAVLVPVAAGFIVSTADVLQSFHIPDSAFWKYVVARLLTSVMPGSWVDLSVFNGPRNFNGPADVMGLLGMDRIGQVLSGPNLWIGVLAGVGMIAGAVWLRRWRDDS